MKVPGINTWLNRTTKQFLTGISSGGMEKKFPADAPFYDGNGEPTSTTKWIHAPNMTPVVGFEAKHWDIVGDTVALKPQAERDAIDAAENTSHLDGVADELDTILILKAFSEAVLDQINQLRADHGRNALTLAQLKTAVRGKL